MLLGLLVACGGGLPADPRETIRAHLVGVSAARPAAELRRSLLLGQNPAACTLAKGRVAGQAEDEDWRSLLRVAARLGAGERGCVDPVDGDALANWGADRDGWRGACAEWWAARGDSSRAAALLDAPGEDGARLRVALGRGDADAARVAAEGALVEAPGDVLACRTLALAALQESDAAWAIELADCDGLGTHAPELVRARGDALDLAGEGLAAEAAYRKAGAWIHVAALLYQDAVTAERLAEATHLLSVEASGSAPPAALHRVWMAIEHGGTLSVDGLDHSVPASLARALVRASDEDVEAIADVPGAPAAIVRARLAADRGDRGSVESELATALADAPASEPVHRARVWLRVRTRGDVEGALADWVLQDPDHVAITGARGARDLPWAAIVPERWEDIAALHPDPRARADAPSGSDAVGVELRAARTLPTASARADALLRLQAHAPGLDGLPAERYRLGPPPAVEPARLP